MLAATPVVGAESCAPASSLNVQSAPVWQVTLVAANGLPVKYGEAPSSVVRFRILNSDPNNPSELPKVSQVQVRHRVAALQSQPDQSFAMSTQRLCACIGLSMRLACPLNGITRCRS